MTRVELEHLLRAAGNIAEVDRLLVIGSQSILGAFPDAPSELRVSMEADLVPLTYPERSVVIDGAIGEGSVFQKTFGYYAHGVGLETATLPRGWQERLVEVCNANTQNVKGLCLEPHDLAVSKLTAGREKDLSFVHVMLDHELIDARRVGERIHSVEDAELAGMAAAQLKRMTPEPPPQAADPES